MANSPIACATCAAQIDNPKPLQKYCDRKCKDRRSRPRPERILSTTYQCWWCGVDYHPKRVEQNKCCSRECGFKWMGFKRRVISGAFAVKHIAFIKRCEVCAKPFHDKSKLAAVCSDTCRRARYAERAKARAKNVFSPVAFSCHECGCHVVTEYGQARKKFCSERCAKRNLGRLSRRKERARLRAVRSEPVDPIAVFDRDNWRCQQCGIKTPRRLRGTTRPNAPEMDHIEPLSKGGSHTYRNVQCLCRSCNCAKSDGPGGQLRLFG